MTKVQKVDFGKNRRDKIKDVKKETIEEPDINLIGNCDIPRTISTFEMSNITLQQVVNMLLFYTGSAGRPPGWDGGKRADICLKFLDMSLVKVQPYIPEAFDDDAFAKFLGAVAESRGEPEENTDDGKIEDLLKPSNEDK